MNDPNAFDGTYYDEYCEQVEKARSAIEDLMPPEVDAPPGFRIPESTRLTLETVEDLVREAFSLLDDAVGFLEEEKKKHPTWPRG